MPDAGLLDQRLQGDLRSDHAGETGAVWIYRGILALSRDAELRAFAREHLATEERHLAFFENWLPNDIKSRLLLLWRLSGWLLGALSLLGGRRGVFLTIEAVETFVVEHYQEQIDYLRDTGQHRQIRAVLRRFQRDEDHHREDAAGRGAAGRGAAGRGAAGNNNAMNRTTPTPGWFARKWVAIVGEGSRLAVVAARRF